MRVSSALAPLREELGFLLAADALGYFGGVVGLGCVAAAVRQAEVVERSAVQLDAKLDRLHAGALVVTGRKVETHRPAAAPAIVAVALAKRVDTRGFRLLPTILPWANELCDRRAHDAINSAFGLPRG